MVLMQIHSRAYFALSRFRRKRKETDVLGYQFIGNRRDAARKFTFVDLALFVLCDAKLDKA